ncbi:MAG: FGGY family carbohydrate kinase, partial [Pseudomonadota bacterium]|nr:FGGY family carbohydrate kinase [Pseudomonadota bacterium]
MTNRKKDSYVLSIDQGTTSSRAIIFDSSFKIRSVHQKEFGQIFPKSGWVEHDALEILQTVIETSQSVARNKEILPSEIATIGITNQRETAVVWDKKSGKPIYNAIVWQDRRTGDLCK